MKQLSLTLLTFAALLHVSAATPLYSQGLPDDIDITGSANGIVPLPATVNSVFTSLFDRYTKIQAPNGEAIHMLLQSQVTDEMGVRAREVLRFYLTDVAGTQYGADKTAIANSMGSLNATLVYFNTEQASNQAFSGPLGSASIFGQDLYATESVVEGTSAFTTNSNRDATLEEVFHLLHGAGIQPTLPAFHAEITAATNAAIARGDYIPPPASELPPADRPFEYIISIIDVYYGLWAHDPDGNGTSFGGEYAYHTRAAMVAGDPLGVAAMLKYLPDSYEAAVSCSPGFSGQFKMTLDAAIPYTLKSQYMRNVALTGANASGVQGNGLDNVLGGNSADNTLDGQAGLDAAVFSGPLSDYTIVCTAGLFTVEDLQSGRDGKDTLISIERLQFSDQTIPASSLCVMASAAVRNGSGVNSLCLTSNSPTLGGVWSASVNTASHPGATMTILVGYATAHAGFTLGIGELLVDPSSPRLLYSVAAVTGTSSVHSVPVPSSSALIGRQVFTQAGIAGGGGELCNGLDLVIGL